MDIELKQFLDSIATVIIDHADTLTTLDQAIGDGDHGINMKRGFTAVQQLETAEFEQPPGAVLQKIGMTLVMKVGGASGPLYGSLFMAMGKALPKLDLHTLSIAFNAGIEAVKARGKSEAGEKTMLDVLIPVAQQFTAHYSDPKALVTILPAAAETGLEATRTLRASKGRAAFLGERSIGHLDPGAMSSCMMIKAVCACAEEYL